MLPDISLLERVFSVLKHHWVYDFFFTSQPDELDQLRHAVTKSSVTTAELDIKTLSHVNQTFQVNEHHRILVIPSFCTSNITVGFAVCEKIASSSHVVSRDVYIGRIARDDLNGTCLFIAQDYNDYITEVTYFSLVSPAQRDHIFSLYHTKRFTAVMKKLRNHYNPSALLPALIYHYCATEARPCPQCGTNLPNSLIPCPCKLPICRKRHPDDTEREMINLRSYFGGYDGIATVGLYSQGKTLFHANYAATSGSRLTIDPESHRRLVLWALCSTTRKRPINPLAFCMAKGVLGTKGISAIDTFLLASIADSVVQENNQTTSSSKTTTSTLALPDISELDPTNAEDSNPDDTSKHNPTHSKSTPSTNTLSLISRPGSVLSTPAISESSTPSLNPQSSTTSLVDDAHPLARLLHRVPPMCPVNTSACPIARSFCPIVAPVLVPEVPSMDSAAKQDSFTAAPEHDSQPNPTNPDNRPPAVTGPSSVPPSVSPPPSEPCDTSAASARPAAALQAGTGSQGLSDTQSRAESQLSRFSRLKPSSWLGRGREKSTLMHSQVFSGKPEDTISAATTTQSNVASQSTCQRPIKTPVPLVAPLIQMSTESQVPTQVPQPPIPLPIPKRLHAHTSLPAQPTPAPSVAFQGQIPLPSQPRSHPSFPVHPPIPMGGVVNPQSVSSRPGPHTAPLQPRRSPSLHPNQSIVLPSQPAPLVTQQGMRPLSSQHSAAMPQQPHETLASRQASHLHPQPMPPLQPQHPSPYQSLHRQGSLSQPLSSMSHPSTLRTAVDMPVSSSGRSMSEVRGTNSCYSDGRGGSEASLERARPLRPAPLQPRYILPMQTAESGTAGGRVSKAAGDELDERRRKAELRKARNRESAQRSNYRRKMRIQALKDDIAAAAKREMLLRAKEKMLREENSTLRRTVKNDC